MAFGQMMSRMSSPAAAPCRVLSNARPTMQITAMEIAGASNRKSFHYEHQAIVKTTCGCRSVMDRCFPEVGAKGENFLWSQPLTQHVSSRPPDYNSERSIYRFFGFPIGIGLAVDASSFSIGITGSLTLMVPVTLMGPAALIASASIFISPKN